MLPGQPAQELSSVHEANLEPRSVSEASFDPKLKIGGFESLGDSSLQIPTAQGQCQAIYVLC